MDELNKAKEIFLTDVDEETYAENIQMLDAWEKELIESENFASWQSHDISKNILKQMKNSYVEITLQLGEDEKLSEKVRDDLFAKKKAISWVLSILDSDYKTAIEDLQKTIRNAIDAT